jgi:molybdate transport system regulatory protein
MTHPQPTSPSPRTRPSGRRRPFRGRQAAATPKYRLWVVFGERIKFGHGRADLLRLIDELGSIKQAVAQVGMSYRYAWGYLRDLEQAVGFKLLKRKPGGGLDTGTRLTAEGRKFLAHYSLFKQSVDGAVDRHFKRVFGGD